MHTNNPNDIPHMNPIAEGVSIQGVSSSFHVYFVEESFPLKRLPNYLNELKLQF